MKTPWTPPTSNIVHRLCDGEKTSCGKGAVRLYAVRFASYLIAFCQRHPDMKICAVCWPAQEVTP